MTPEETINKLQDLINQIALISTLGIKDLEALEKAEGLSGARRDQGPYRDPPPMEQDPEFHVIVDLTRQAYRSLCKANFNIQASMIDLDRLHHPTSYSSWDMAIEAATIKKIGEGLQLALSELTETTKTKLEAYFMLQYKLSMQVSVEAELAKREQTT